MVSPQCIPMQAWSKSCCCCVQPAPPQRTLFVTVPVLGITGCVRETKQWSQAYPEPLLPLLLGTRHISFWPVSIIRGDRKVGRIPTHSLLHTKGVWGNTDSCIRRGSCFANTNPAEMKPMTPGSSFMGPRPAVPSAAEMLPSAPTVLCVLHLLSMMSLSSYLCARAAAAEPGPFGGACLVRGPGSLWEQAPILSAPVTHLMKPEHDNTQVWSKPLTSPVLSTHTSHPQQSCCCQRLFFSLKHIWNFLHFWRFKSCF